MYAIADVGKMACSWSAGVDIEEVGVVVHKTINELRSCAGSIVKTAIDCVKKIIGWIDKLIRNSPQFDHESRELLERLGEDLEKLKSIANRVLKSCKDLAEVASDEYRIDCIKKEVKKRHSGAFRRALEHVKKKFSRSQTSTCSELKVFLKSVHDRILICTDAVTEFYQYYDLLLGNIEKVIDAKSSKLSELKNNVKHSSTANAVTSKMVSGGWTSGVICSTVCAVATVLSGGAAAPVMVPIANLAGAGFMTSWVIGVTGQIASSVSDSALCVSFSEYNYLEDILQDILGMQKEMNTIKSSVKAMDASINNAKDVLNNQLNHYAELSFYRDDDRENIEASLDDLQDYMKDLIRDIESYTGNHDIKLV